MGIITAQNALEIRQAFTFYTDNADALTTAAKIEPLVPKVEDKHIRETERLLCHIEKEVYNGKDAVPWENAGKVQKNGQRSFGLRRLASLNDAVPSEDKIRRLEQKSE